MSKPVFIKTGTCNIGADGISFVGQWKLADEDISDEKRVTAMVEWAANRLLKTLDNIEESNKDKGANK